MAESVLQRGNRTWSRGYTALWILFAACSAYYIFYPSTEPAALGQQPVSDLPEIRSALQEFSQQIAALDARLALMEENFELPPEALNVAPTPKKVLETIARKQPQADRPDESTTVQEDFTFCRKWAGTGSVACRRRDGTVVRVRPDESVLAYEEDQDQATNEPPVVAPVEDFSQERGRASSTAALKEELTETSGSAHGIVLGTASGEVELMKLWSQLLSNHSALVAGLEPRRWLGPDNRWRLIAGPFPTAREAEAACELFHKASYTPCNVSIYAGDRI
jgi:hypothetical protein